VKLRSQNVKSRDANDDVGRCAFWPQNTNFRWVHMWSHRVAVICTMEFTSAVARLCIMPDSRAASTEDQGRCVWIRSYALASFDCRERILRGDSPVTVTRPVPAAAP
jgi:hypothetical protein